ncbi:MAG: translation initiation factor IF-6 [Desulfurococcaceae archaeon]|jgi:translation initiation factor 6|nr:translation initiation factor IF-6 [Desulfurococcaceae archaeon]
MHGSVDRVRVLGSPHIGTYMVVTDNLALVPKGAGEDLKRKIMEVLSVNDIIEISIAGTALIGIFAVASGRKVVVPDIIKDEELEDLRSLGLSVDVVEASNFNALGNVVLHNSRAAVFHPELDRDVAMRIAEALNLGTYTQTPIAGIPTVGSAAVVTDRGGLVHPSASEEELKKLSELFGIELDVGTINFGIGFIKSGLVANNYGVLVGELTTGPEIVRIMKAFKVGR